MNNIFLIFIIIIILFYTTRENFKTTKCPANSYYVNNHNCVQYCPAGLKFNQNNNTCTESIIPNCPIGYKFDQKIKKCIISVIPKCPTNYTFNSEIDQCVITTDPTCPGNKHKFDGNNCIKIICPNKFPTMDVYGQCS
jgi:hypothetical protein